MSNFYQIRDGFKAKLIEKAKEFGLTKPTQLGYMMATVEWETANTFEPVREAYWLSEQWRKDNFRYYPYYGRGYVQITWLENYEKYSKLTGKDLVNNPDMAMDCDTALFILVDGFKYGRFTGHRLEQYVSDCETNYYDARLCINGRDKAHEIAAIASEWSRYF